MFKFVLSTESSYNYSLTKWLEVALYPAQETKKWPHNNDHEGANMGEEEFLHPINLYPSKQLFLEHKKLPTRCPALSHWSWSFIRRMFASVLANPRQHHSVRSKSWMFVVVAANNPKFRVSYRVVSAVDPRLKVIRLLMYRWQTHRRLDYARNCPNIFDSQYSYVSMYF
jgi:hypothetical protein